MFTIKLCEAWSASSSSPAGPNRKSRSAVSKIKARRFSPMKVTSLRCAAAPPCMSRADTQRVDSTLGSGSVCSLQVTWRHLVPIPTWSQSAAVGESRALITSAEPQEQRSPLRVPNPQRPRSRICGAPFGESGKLAVFLRRSRGRKVTQQLESFIRW